MKHFFVKISASEGPRRAEVRVGPFGSPEALEEWVHRFGHHFMGTWQPSDPEEEEGTPVPSHDKVVRQLREQLSSATVKA